ncbi:MAG TPA: hypothetical protein VJ044_08650, partial [Candidatus Hodarchaeales archaeon]|nr:hypothetical protein [Candidatus Hodarchaeales archaeon]
MPALLLIESLMVILIFIGTGLATVRLLGRYISMDISEQFIAALVISSGFLLVPLTLLGVADNTKNLFFSWNYIFAFGSAVGLFFIANQSLHNFLAGMDRRSIKIDKSVIFPFLACLGLIMVYIFYSVVLPLRGFDALWMYLPNALWYYQIESIPPLNPL